MREIDDAKILRTKTKVVDAPLFQTVLADGHCKSTVDSQDDLR